jgi:hypothetical protein
MTISNAAFSCTNHYPKFKSLYAHDIAPKLITEIYAFCVPTVIVFPDVEAATRAVSVAFAARYITAETLIESAEVFAAA